MNYKRKGTKNTRRGCLMCKPNKMTGWNNERLGNKGFGKIRALIHANEDLKQAEIYTIKIGN